MTAASTPPLPEPTPDPAPDAPVRDSAQNPTVQDSAQNPAVQDPATDAPGFSDPMPFTPVDDPVPTPSDSAPDGLTTAQGRGEGIE